MGDFGVPIHLVKLIFEGNDDPSKRNIGMEQIGCLYIDGQKVCKNIDDQ